MALFHSKKLLNPYLGFELEAPPPKLVVRFILITSVERKDGSDESWNIEGVEQYTSRRCKIYFQTKRRGGNLQYLS